MKKSKGLCSIISVVTALSIMLTCVIPAFSAYADGGIYHNDEIQIYYQDSDTMVPDTDDEGNSYREVMVEGDKLQLTYKLIETGMPDGGSVYWYSDTPTLVNVDQTGLVRAFDSSKGAAIQTWIDSSVKTIPLIGGAIGSLIEGALFNDVVDLDSMDTDQIVSVLKIAFGNNSYADSVLDSLQNYLDSLNSIIHCQLKDAQGNVVCEDTVKIQVKKNEAWYANFLPNGTHITNKEEVSTTVAVGSTVQLTAITTPLRLHYGVNYSIRSSSIFNNGAEIATVDEDGFVTFTGTGTVTVTASPDSEDVLEGVKKMLIFIDGMLDSAEGMDTDAVADVLINYLGVNVSKTVLKGALDLMVAARQRTGGISEYLENSNGTLQTLANYALQFAYNDSITFTVIDPVPLEDFSLSGLSSVQEGSQIQLSVTDIVPETGDKNEVRWSSSNPNIAYVDEDTGIITGRDSGGSLSTSSQEVTINATSIENHISRSKTIKVTGKTGQYLSDIVIEGPDYIDTNEECDFTYTAYPSRTSSWDLTVKWGLVSGYDDEGNEIISWATGETPAADNFAEIDKNGHYTSIGNGTSTIVLEVKTGYDLSDGSFYEISSITKKHEISNSTPVKSIKLSPEKLSNSSTPDVKEVIVNGETTTFVTVKESTAAILYNKGIKVSAAVNPENAANANIIWHIDNDSFQFKNESTSAKSVEVRAKYGSESAASVNIWCESEDGNVKSDTITLVLTRNNAASNTIDGDEFEVARGKSLNVTHTMTFDGSLTANLYACDDAHWYSDNEKVLKVSDSSDGNAVITGVDVGYANLYCVSADGGLIDSKPVTVVADKDYLSNIVNLCDRTVIQKTDENKTLYSEYMKKLDKAYFVLYDYKMASQSTCNTYADNLLDVFNRIGAYVPVGGVSITSRRNEALAKPYVSVNVGTLSSYTSSTYDLNYALTPSNSMYSKIEWVSSSSAVSVDSSGVCRPTSNNACAAKITCNVFDYLGNVISDSVYIAFSKTPATGIELNTYSIEEGKFDETYTLGVTVLPNERFNSVSYSEVAFKSSDERVASVDENGVISFNRGGQCVITVTTIDGGFTAECNVNVVTNFNKLGALISSYESAGLQRTDYYPATYDAFAEVLEEAKEMVDEASASQDEADAMYDKLEDAYNSLEVYHYITSTELYLDGEKAADYYQEKVGLLTSYTSASQQINVRLYPYNGSYESIEWSSSNSDVTVSDSGLCKPASNKACYSTITCTVTDHFGNAFEDSVHVSFARNPVTSIELSTKEIFGDIDETAKLSYTISPSSANIKAVTFASDNEDVATVDASGNVTFVSTGAANITVTTCDGGFTDVCFVATKGDREALDEAVEAYKDINYLDYEYEYGIAFKEAYEAAVTSQTDYFLNQDQIDERVETLNSAYEALKEHPFIEIEEINLDYVGKNGYGTEKERGSVDERNSVSISFSNGYSNIFTTNTCAITASVYPENAMYSNLRIETVDSTRMRVQTSGATATCNATLRNGGIANLKFIYTDAYGRETSRTITVVMAEYTVTGINIEQDDFSVVATDGSAQLTANLSSGGSLSFSDIKWTSSDDETATVDSNGLVTFINDGEVTITARSVDGGYTDSVTITILADYSKLAEKVAEYAELIETTRGKFVYTNESLDVLEAAVNESAAIVEEATARQALVNENYDKLVAAYETLEKYVPCESITLGLSEDETSASVVNEGYIRLSNSSLNNKTIKLAVETSPARSRYEEISWESSNSNISVASDGTVTSNNSSSKAALITCTVTNYDGETHTNTIYVSFVRYGVTGISFSDNDVYGVSGATASISPSISYSSSWILSSSYVCNDCIWTSDNPEIATVDENGTVTFVSFGKATITATTMDGGYTASKDVYTTWDTTALNAAISEGSKIEYTDYAYSYGMDFKNKYESAVAVSKNYLASQGEIDSACELLMEAMSALEGHEFIKPNPAIMVNGESISNNASIPTDENNQVEINAYIVENAMIKSSSFTYSNAEGLTVEQNGNQLVLTRTEDKGYITLNLNVVDDYDREYSLVYNVTIVEQIVNATDIVLTANGEEIGSNYAVSCSGSYSNFPGLTVGYNTVPANANAVSSVSYKTSSSLSPIKINSLTGVVNLSGASSWLSSYSVTITCTVTNTDGSTVTKSFTLKVTKA